MNIVQQLTTRERKGNVLKCNGYDNSLFRLKCFEEDVYHWASPNLNAPDLIGNPPVFACQFSKAPGHENILALANEDGKIALQDTAVVKNGSQEIIHETQAHCNAIFDIAWMPQELKLVTASGEKTACLWDVSSSNVEMLQVFAGHTFSVKTAVFRHEDKAVFATGARDGAIMIWDIRANHNGFPKADNTILNAHGVKPLKSSRRTPPIKAGSCNGQSIQAIRFQDDYTLFSCADGDGLIKVWDLRKNYTVHKKDPIAKHILKYGGKSNTYRGFTSLLVDPHGIKLYASCVDKTIYAYNISTYNPNPIAEYYGHGTNTPNLNYFVKACLSPDGKYLISGSNDESAYIWKTSKPGLPFLKLSEHRDEVTCIAWSNSHEIKIVTCSDDCDHRIWRIKPDPDCEEKNIFGVAVPYETLQYQTPKKSSVTNSSPSVYSSGGSSKSHYSLISIEHNKPTLSPIPEIINPDRSSPKRATEDSRAARKLLFSPSNNNKSPTSSSSTTREPFSPTVGLPNFVIDGTAPHLHFSPQKCKENRQNWLTEYGKNKQKRKHSDISDDETDSPKTNKRTPGSRKKGMRTNKKMCLANITKFCSSVGSERSTT